MTTSANMSSRTSAASGYGLQYNTDSSCDLDITEVGSWWGGTKGEQDEIDVVALSSRREAVLFGECKWSNSPWICAISVDFAMLLRFTEGSSLRSFPPWRLCFSRSGFHLTLF